MIDYLIHMETKMLDKFLSKKGQICGLTMEKKLKTKKSFSGVITKRTKMTVRAGVQYDNITAVKEARETGELPAENAGLPWGQWKIYPYVIEHNGKNYLRFSKLNGGQIETQYYLDGKEVKKSEIESFALASEFKTSGDFEVFSVSEENVKELV